MNRRKVIFGVLALVVCGVLAVVFWPEKPEPVYVGKKLSQWVLAQYSIIEGTAEEAQFHEAIQKVGTNGIPFYLEWISYEPGLLKKAELKLAAVAQSRMHLKWYPRDHKHDRGTLAIGALQDLGERATPAIPQLLACVTRPPDIQNLDRPRTAIMLLGGMGTPGTAAYLSLVTNKDARVRALAIAQS